MGLERPDRATRLFVSPDAHARLGAARAWLAAERQRDTLRPLGLLATDREAASDFVHALLVDAAERGEGAALFNVYRPTLRGLARDLSRSLMAERELTPATALCLQALVGRVVHQAHAELSHLGRIPQTVGLNRALTRTLGELRAHHVSADALEPLAPGGPDLARLLRAYEQALAQERLLDGAGLLKLAVEVLASASGEPPHPLLGGSLLLLDFELRHPSEVELLAALTAGGCELTAVMPAGDRVGIEALAPLFDHEPAPHVPESDRGLARLQCNLFGERAQPARERNAGDGVGSSQHAADLDALGAEVDIFSAATAALEAVEIARRILRLADEGVAAEQIAVLLRQPLLYADLLDEALHRAGLPLYLAEGLRQPDPAGRAFLLLLRCALEGLSATRFAEYLSLGQLPRMLEGEHEGLFLAPTRWERLIGDAAVVQGLERWRARLAALALELRARRERLEDPDEGVGRAIDYDLRQLDALERFALPLLERLAALPSEASWGHWIEALLDLADAALPQAEHVREVLGELWPLAHAGPVPLTRVLETLGDRLTELCERPHGTRDGRVFVGSIEQARGRAFEVVFVPGLAERLFPAKVLQDPVLLDRARRQLEQGRARTPLLSTNVERRERERLGLRLAVGAARRQVVLSYPRAELGGGRAQVPSFYLLEAARAVIGALPPFEALIGEAARRGAEAARPHPLDPTDAIDAQEFDLATLAAAERLRGDGPATSVGGYCAHLHRHPHLITALRAHWQRGTATRLTPSDGLLAGSEAVQQALAERGLRRRAYSVTGLEHFVHCPYRFYLHSVLRLRPPPPIDGSEGWLDPATRGTILHRVLFEFLRALRDRDALPPRAENLAAAQSLLSETLGRVADEYRQRLAPAIELLWREELDRLASDLRAWLLRESAQQGYLPLVFEYAFGQGPAPTAADGGATAAIDESSPAGPAQVGEWLLRGTVDLVERRTDGRLRVTDFKTGAAPSQPSREQEGSRRLQRVLYALAYESLNPGSEAVEGSLYYCTERGGFRRDDVLVDARLREQSLELLRFIDDAICRGKLPAVPDPGCEQCDFVVVCGRDAAARGTKKLGRSKDPWLRALQRIRRA